MAQVGANYDALALLPGEAGLGRTAAQGSKGLHKAAVEFESVLLGQWLQSAEKSFASVPDGDEDEDSGGEQMMSFAMQQLAGSLASRGVLGIGKLVERSLEKAAEGAGAGTASATERDGSKGRSHGSRIPEDQPGS